MCKKGAHILAGLNESQKNAVMTTEGPVLIVAGPGTGKTFTIVRRIAYLVDQGVKPEHIAAVTFTNRAAREMRERSGNLAGKEAGRIFIGTFHMLGLSMLKDGNTDHPMIINREEQIDILKRLCKDSDSAKSMNEGKRVSYQKIIEKISRMKNFLEDIDVGRWKLYEAYQSALTNRNVLDFDDLILKPLEILGNEKLASPYRHAFTYIMVDEYQDINPAQYRFVKLLAGKRRNLCAIGDSDQAIYAFRGADLSNFLSFEDDFKDAKRVVLTEHYRSTATILNAADALIMHNRGRIAKELKPVRDKGRTVTILSVPDERAEGEAIIQEIEKHIGGTSHYQLAKKTVIPSTSAGEENYDADGSYCFDDFAVIFRTNAQAKALEESFHVSGIPFQVIGEKYLQRKKQFMFITAFLKAVINPADNQHADALPKKPSEALLEKFGELKDKVSPGEFLHMLRAEAVIDQYIQEENFTLLEEIAAAYQHLSPSEGIISFINELSLFTPADLFHPKADAVALMTLHMAKGLEFKAVFIAGVEEGLIPYTMNKEDVATEEERRLFYVGMTRAMDELFLIHARSRFLYGQRHTPSPSPFLREISSELLQSRVIPDRIKREKRDNQMGLF
jgi:DNA helicase II / ATP-dependent DNA helicase PcrA